MGTKILVKSSSRIDPYEVLVASNEGGLSIYCNCPAGEWGKYCKHKMALVLGDEKILYDNHQIDNFNKVSKLIQESNYPVLIAELQDSEKKLEVAKKTVQSSKDKIAHLMKEGLK
jgi:uncharacterized Zn finger protein